MTGENFIKKVVLGLTGYFCSGKSAAANILEKKHNFFIIDVDSLGHEALEEEKKSLCNSFGEKILTNGKIDRKKLGNIVFNNKQKLKELNSIVHPVMVKKVKTILEDEKKTYICINAALLFDMNLDRFCKSILIVKSSIITIIKRAKRRNNFPFLKVLRILISQKGLRAVKKRKFSADICYISNNNDFNHLENNIEKILKEKNII